MNLLSQAQLNLKQLKLSWVWHDLEDKFKYIFKDKFYNFKDNIKNNIKDNIKDNFKKTLNNWVMASL